MLSFCKRVMIKYKTFIMKMWEDHINNGGVTRSNQSLVENFFFWTYFCRLI